MISRLYVRIFFIHMDTSHSRLLRHSSFIKCNKQLTVQYVILLYPAYYILVVGLVVGCEDWPTGRFEHIIIVVVVVIIAIVAPAYNTCHRRITSIIDMGLDRIWHPQLYMYEESTEMVRNVHQRTFRTIHWFTMTTNRTSTIKAPSMVTFIRSTHASMSYTWIIIFKPCDVHFWVQYVSSPNGIARVFSFSVLSAIY